MNNSAFQLRMLSCKVSISPLTICGQLLYKDVSGDPGSWAAEPPADTAWIVPIPLTSSKVTDMRVWFFNVGCQKILLDVVISALKSHRPYKVKMLKGMGSRDLVSYLRTAGKGLFLSCKSFLKYSSLVPMIIYHSFCCQLWQWKCTCQTHFYSLWLFPFCKFDAIAWSPWPVISKYNLLGMLEF